MSRGAGIAVVVSALVGAVFMAGFVRGEPSPQGARAKQYACAPEPRMDPPAKVAWSVAEASPPPASKPGGLLALTSSPNYRRAADLALKVEDCTKAEDALEARLEAIKGEILDMVMEGTEGSRTCTLSALIPADKFREFIVDLRKMGKVQSERITASRLKPGGEKAGAGDPDAADPRELSLVSIRMADEKVAQSVLESRGLLASSFDRSASHFMNGLAVLVEALGYVLPFFMVLAALIVPIGVAVKLRRARRAAC